MHLGAAARHEAGGDASRLSVEQSGEGEGRPERRRTYVSYLAPIMLWSAGTRIGGHRSRPDLYSALHSPTERKTEEGARVERRRGPRDLRANGGLEGAAKARSAKPARGRYLYSSTTLWRSYTTMPYVTPLKSTPQLRSATQRCKR